MSVQTFRLRTRDMIRLVSESLSIATGLVPRRALRRLITESISIQTFRTRGRVVVRLIGETLEIATATKTIRGRI